MLCLFSRFFIDRPIFASVISIVITLVGSIALSQLPLAQYPPIAPPNVQVDCNYPGASALTVAETVAAPIEQQVNGVEDMMYMSSASTNDGSYSLTVTFKPGVDMNLAQVLVQNRVSLALPALPEVVRRTGVTTRKRSPDILLTVSINSPDGSYDQLYLSNYARLHLQEELGRIRGVSEVRVFGQRDYSMRVWLDPDKLAARELVVSDVITAVREQNMEVALGQLGQPPALSGQMWQIPLTVAGRLRTPEEFGAIVVRATADGRMLRIRDVGRVEIAARIEETNNRFNMKPTVGLAIFQLPEANALETADLVKAKMEELSVDFPAGVIYEAGYDTTPFIRESVNEVFKSLRDAIILVAIVVLFFLQGWRPAIIPLIAVPVAIIGTFAAMAVVGFSLNTLTLFGLVLAIGIVVDDAIVVVEAVEQHIERGLAPRQAAFLAMEEVAGPVIAVGLVLTAVFVPCAFVSGIVGQFFRQFALTIAISTVLSTINSLTLSPALAALLLKPRNEDSHEAFPRPGLAIVGALLGYFQLGPWLATRSANVPALATIPGAAWPWIAAIVLAICVWFVGRYINLVLKYVFAGFNWAMQRTVGGYAWMTSRMLRLPGLVLLVYGCLLVCTWKMYDVLPVGFIPSQDKGYMTASVQLPDATAAEQTLKTLAKVEAIALETEGVANINSIAGNSFQLGARASNFCSMFIILEPFDERRTDNLRATRIQAELLKKFDAAIPEATITLSPPPPVPRVGRAGGFKMMLEDRGNIGLGELQKQTDALIVVGKEQPELTGLYSVFNNDAPQLRVDVDRDACLSQGISLGEAFGTLQGYLGSRYVNDFNMSGRTWQVVVQADARFRDRVDDVAKLKIRNRDGKMVPLGSICTVKPIGGPLLITRYNMYPATAVTGNVAEGISSGEGIQRMEALAGKELPASMAYEWTEMAYLERISGNTGLMLFAFSVVFVFLVLAALYESWALPLAVILVVPMCILFSLLGIATANWNGASLDINVFTQIGFVVLIGLACKNAILIVEFAKVKRDAGVDAHDAILDACRMRLRPILMTSFAFILGVLPLVVAEGAGWEMRRALGTAVFSGMLGVTLFGVFLTPVFFLVVDRMAHWQVFSTGLFARVGNLMLRGLRLGFVIGPTKRWWQRVVTATKPTDLPE